MQNTMVQNSLKNEISVSIYIVKIIQPFTQTLDSVTKYIYIYNIHT